MINLSLAKVLALIVAGVWIVLILIFLIMKDFKDRKYNKVLKTKEQMLKDEENKI